MEVGFKSDKGLLRANNEDAFFIMLKDKICIVADGVGGGNAGEIASRTAVSQIANYIKNNPVEVTDNKYRIARYFKRCLDSANSTVYDMSLEHEQNNGMATTVVMVYMADGKAYVCNVGDSRAYLYREGQMVQMTEDHTYVNALVKAGILTEEEAAVDERKNVITKALGAEERVEPDFFQVEVAEGDRILLCTDGLYDEVDETEIIAALNEENNMSDVCRRLIDTANANGGHDNITIVSLKVTKEDIHE